MFVMKKVGRLMEGGEMLAAYRARSDSDERKRDRKTKRIILSEYNRQMFAKGIFAKSFRQAAKRTATARRAFVAVALASAASLSQSKGETSHAAALEFPVVLQQNVVAGKTAVGAKVQAKLTIATLLHGVVTVSYTHLFRSKSANTLNTSSKSSFRQDQLTVVESELPPVSTLAARCSR